MCRFVSGISHHRHLGYDLQEVVAEVELHQVGDALEAPSDDDLDAAVSEVDLLQVVQVPLPQHVLVDTKEVVERQVEDLGGGVQHGDLGQGGVDALHRLLPA